MTRTHSWLRTLALALSVAAFLAFATGESGINRAVAQDAGKPQKDAALDDLLRDIKDTKAKPDAPVDKAKPAPDKPRPPAPEPAKPTAPKAAEKPQAKASGATRPAADVAPKDKALDSLLEKLGETPDKPAPDERRGAGGMPPPDDKNDKKPADGPRKPTQELTGKSKDLDEHLEELTGRRKKKKEGDEGSGPLSDVIKEMRDVEQRLGKPDTGEETRKKQQQIVKNLETLIEQMRASSGQSQGKMKRQLAMKPGEQPGPNSQGQTPGTTGGNAPHTKPEKPTNKRSLAGGKDEWGHLPPELRQEMENVFREEFLPSREELIKRYYDSVARKAVKRGE